MKKKRRIIFERTDRLETLCDGVFAVVMTVLVFDLKVPKTEGPLVDEIWKLWPKFASYIISFLLVGIYWIAHHNQFNYIRRMDRNFIWMNILFLMLVSLIPFSASLIGEHPFEQTSIIVYALNLISIGFVMRAYMHYATKEHRLVDSSLDPVLVDRIKKIVLIQPVAYMIAIAISFFNVRASLFFFLMVPPVFIFPGIMEWLLPLIEPVLNKTANEKEND